MVDHLIHIVEVRFVQLGRLQFLKIYADFVECKLNKRWIKLAI
jgi:hypothetical protein